MDPGSPTLLTHVRTFRDRAKLRPSELARRVGMTRQALHSIETGVYVPNTLIAIRLARALECQVEDLFSLPKQLIRAAVIGRRQNGSAPLSGMRVQLAQVDLAMNAPWLALPLSGEASWAQSADGVLLNAAGADGLCSVELFGDLTLARQTAVLVGCDPSLGLAAIHVSRHAPDVRVLWQSASSLEALRSLARGEAHAAGIHLWEASTGVSNLGAVERELPGQKAHLYTLWEWEQGLIVAPGNPKGLTGAESLVLPGVRLVNREEGAGSRALLDAWLADLKVTLARRRKLPGYGDEVHSHLEAAGRVAAGLADVAPGPRSAAQALGLDFLPIQRERFDLVIPEPFLEHPAIVALIAVARQQPFRAELSTLGGYDPAHAGEFWQSTA